MPVSDPSETINQQAIIAVKRHAPHLDGRDAWWIQVCPDEALWNRAEIADPAKLVFQTNLLFTALDGRRITPPVMVGNEGGRGCFHGRRESNRRRDVGPAIARPAEQALAAFGRGKR